MSAFGRKNGPGAIRPAFGVAKPMHVLTPQSAVPEGVAIPADPLGGSQFPPLDPTALPALDGSEASPQQARNAEAMARLQDRMNADHSQQEGPQGFEASVHKIKEQVLPRLLERVDPEAAATLTKDELAEEFRPIIMEVLAELKLTLNRREQFALEKVLVDELLGLGPLEELIQIPTSRTSWSTARSRPISKRRASFSWHRSSSATRNTCSRSRSASSTRSAAASTRPRRWPTPACLTAARQRHRAAALAARHRDLDS
jgi:hypothetical protein